MTHQNPADPQANVNIHTERLDLVRKLLDKLSHREVLALAASAAPAKHFSWASLGPGAGLTEDQEDFIDYWSPSRVLKECQAQRELIGALDDWALMTESPKAHELVSRFLTALADADVDDR
jgi:hypothetical protein